VLLPIAGGQLAVVFVDDNVLIRNDTGFSVPIDDGSIGEDKGNQARKPENSDEVLHFDRGDEETSLSDWSG